MNNNITEDYCSFEVSKLLKEKGFDAYARFYYMNLEEGHKNRGELMEGGDAYSIRPYMKNSDYKHNQTIIAPTHALAIKWIRENFEIHIYTSTLRPNEWHYSYRLLKGKEYKLQFGDNKYNSPEEATEAALLYTLKNLT